MLLAMEEGFLPLLDVRGLILGKLVTFSYAQVERSGDVGDHVLHTLVIMARTSANNDAPNSDQGFCIPN
jgi:hypothetical protein